MNFFPFWTSKNLSFAGRLKLLQLVLYSIQNFWPGMFKLPKKVIKIVEQQLYKFLQNGPDEAAGNAKVAWESLCVSKKGELGLKGIEEWNKLTCFLEPLCSSKFNLGGMVSYKTY